MEGTWPSGTGIDVERTPFGQNIEVLLTYTSTAGVTSIAEPPIFRELAPGEYPTSATFSISQQRAQDLMDQLWRCGLRPTEGTGSAGSLAATERHLTDMQAIVKGLLKKDGIEV